jgi:hypothetical protein
MKNLLPLLLLLAASGCEEAHVGTSAGDGDTDGDSDTDIDTDADADGDSDTDTQYTGPAIPETCAQAAEATTTVGCLFYAVDLDSHDSVETQQYAVAVSNVNQTNTAHVEVYQGNAATSGWDLHSQADVGPMSLHTFNLPDYHMNSSGLMPKGSYKVVSDVPIIAYQFNPVDGASSYLSDASMLIPVASLALTYDVVGWKQSCTAGGLMDDCDGDMRAYFTVVATVDGTVVTVEPAVAPLAGGVVPGTGAPFTVNMNDGDVLEVQTDAPYASMTGSRITANDGHPIAVFSGQECAFIPFEVYACDHLEEQMPGLRFWGKEMIAARMPVRSTVDTSDKVLWQIYSSEPDNVVQLSASAGVQGLPWSQMTLAQGQLVEFAVWGNAAQPGDFFIEADKPIAVMQYMIGSTNENCNGIGDPAMVYTSPTEQFLPRYVVLVPGTWIYDTLIVTRHAGVDVLLDGATVPNSAFVQVASSGYEVARIPADDGIHTLESADPGKGLAVIVVGYDSYDSYAYAGGMGMGAINPVVE